MDLNIDPNATLAELQLTLFMAAISALVELAKTTDKDHIKLRALTEVARLCNPAKRPALTPHGTRSASDGPQAPATSHATSSPPAPISVARARRSEGSERFTPSTPSTPSSPSRPSCSIPNLNRRQRRLLARLEANDRKREHKQRIAA